MAGLVSTLNTLMAAAVAALEAEDYVTAYKKAIAAQGIAGSIPDLTRSAGTGGGTQAAKWTPDGINNFVASVRKLMGASLGVQSMNIENVEPEQYSDGSQFSATPGGLVQ